MSAALITLDRLPKPVDGHWAAIVRLLFGCRPAAIFGRIGAIVVNAVELVRRTWFAAHVGKEVLVVAPPFADFDPSATPIFITGSSWAIATRAQSKPCAIFRRLLLALSVLTLSQTIVLANDVSMKASAGLTIASPQVVAENDAFIPAIAMTQKASIALPYIREGKHGQAPEALPCKVKHHAHIIGTGGNV